MAQQISIATKSSGDTLTAGELNTIVEGINAAITEVNENKSAADLKNQQQDNSISNKVDKVSGKGLSTEDYTTEEKTKLAVLSNNYNLEAEASFPTAPLVLATGFDYLLIFDIAARSRTGEVVLKTEMLLVQDNDREGGTIGLSSILHMSTFDNDADILRPLISDLSDDTMSLTFSCSLDADIRLTIRPIPVISGMPEMPGGM